MTALTLADKHLIALRQAMMSSNVGAFKTPEYLAAGAYADALIEAQKPTVMAAPELDKATPEEIVVNIRSALDAALALAGFPAEPDNPRAPRTIVAAVMK